MTTVFIGGSRKVGRLNVTIRGRLDGIVSKNLQVVIGDANGGDRAVQEYLAQKGYHNVLVFCMPHGCRNNVGAWPVRIIEARGERGFEYYALKDAEMARVADCGFMLWDGKSRGTLSNMRRLLVASKPVVVYLRPKRKCWTLRTLLDIDLLLHTTTRVAEEPPFEGPSSSGQTRLFAPAHLGEEGALANDQMQLTRSATARRRGPRR